MTREQHEQLRVRLLLFAYRCRLELWQSTKTVPPSVLALLQLAKRLKGSFMPRIAFAGRFSAGKTTLVNSILGNRILREGMSETTAIPTRVRHGDSIRLFLKGSTGEYYQASDSEMQEFMDLSASNIRSELLKRYLKEQDEAVLEHPQAIRAIEVVDLPGVSSSYRQIEDKALESLVFANGVVWVANAKEGGLTGSDIDYLQKHVPQETPKLIVLTHLDLLPPSGVSQVIDKAKASVANIPKVVGVVGASKGQPLSTSPQTQPHWDTLVSESQKNRRVKPLLRDIIQSLENLQSQVDEEHERAVQEYLRTVGASLDDYERFLDKLFEHSKQAIFQMNALVDGKRDSGTFHIDQQRLDSHMRDSIIRCMVECETVTRLIRLKKEQVSDGGLPGALPVLMAALSCHEAASFALRTLLYGVWLASSVLGWRFETPFEDADLAQAFEKMWNLRTLGDSLLERLRDLYSGSLDEIKHAMREYHPLHMLYKEGQRLLESKDLDQIG